MQPSSSSHHACTPRFWVRTITDRLAITTTWPPLRPPKSTIPISRWTSCVAVTTDGKSVPSVKSTTHVETKPKLSSRNSLRRCWAAWPDAPVPPTSLIRTPRAASKLCHQREPSQRERRATTQLANILPASLLFSSHQAIKLFISKQTHSRL